MKSMMQTRKNRNPSEHMKFSFRQEGDTIDFYVYDDIAKSGYDWWTDKEEVGTVDQVRELLENNPDAKRMNIYINSNGGDVFECYAVMSILERHKSYKTAYIDGLAASAASLLPMACNKIVMASYASIMIHNMWTMTWGDANALREMADTLDKLMESNRAKYMERFKGTEAELKAMMDAETYLSAKECLELGLCDEIAQRNGDDIEDPDEDEDVDHIDDDSNDETNKDEDDKVDEGETSTEDSDDMVDDSDDDSDDEDKKQKSNVSFFEIFKNI